MRYGSYAFVTSALVRSVRVNMHPCTRSAAWKERMTAQKEKEALLRSFRHFDASQVGADARRYWKVLGETTSGTGSILRDRARPCEIVRVLAVSTARSCEIAGGLRKPGGPRPPVGHHRDGARRY